MAEVVNFRETVSIFSVRISSHLHEIMIHALAGITLRWWYICYTAVYHRHVSLILTILFSSILTILTKTFIECRLQENLIDHIILSLILIGLVYYHYALSEHQSHGIEWLGCMYTTTDFLLHKIWLRLIHAHIVTSNKIEPCWGFHVLFTIHYNPDSRVHGVSMGPTWALSAPDGPCVGPMNHAIKEVFRIPAATSTNID